MTFATLTIIIHLAFPLVTRINFEDISDCHTARDNLFFDYYRKVHRGLILPVLEVSCISVKSESGNRRIDKT
jgi:hypothetical protein